MNSYNIDENEKMSIIINSLGCEAPKYFQTLMNKKELKCKAGSGLFEVLKEKFKLQQNETILSLQYCKWIREGKECAEELMGCWV